MRWVIAPLSVNAVLVHVTRRPTRTVSVHSREKTRMTKTLESRESCAPGRQDPNLNSLSRLWRNYSKRAQIQNNSWSKKRKKHLRQRLKGCDFPSYSPNISVTKRSKPAYSKNRIGQLSRAAPAAAPSRTPSRNWLLLSRKLKNQYPCLRFAEIPIDFPTRSLNSWQKKSGALSQSGRHCSTPYWSRSEITARMSKVSTRTLLTRWQTFRSPARHFRICQRQRVSNSRSSVVTLKETCVTVILRSWTR